MKTDVEIAQDAVIEPIQKIAAKLGIDEDNQNSMESTRQRLPPHIGTN